MKYWWMIVLMGWAAGIPVLAGAEEQIMQLHFSEFGGYAYHASSTLDADSHVELGTYGMHTLFDGDTWTGWSEGSDGSGIGERLWLRIDPGSDTVAVINGFARSERLFLANNRVQGLRVRLWGGWLPDGMVTEYGPVYLMAPVSDSYALDLQDSRELQMIALPFDYSAAELARDQLRLHVHGYAERQGLPERMVEEVYLIEFEIVSVFPGNRWDDTCLSELRVFPRDTYRAQQLYGEDGVIRYDRTQHDNPGRGRTLLQSRDYLYDPYLVDPAGEWVVAFRTPRTIEGRVESVAVLLRLPLPVEYQHAGFRDLVDAGGLAIEFVPGPNGTVLLFDDGQELVLE
ncbi:NADase-type glycan-binding domain-containing protein [Spirochaeta africana]|uniref:NAD glycohydrolase translocation F5/8 type C domain-containing protein n=1 Tax=Spirochaeta africana (strain ATCC 700263 / DSM 8902 / Z-7692) TaxID=889378 RepID=H9UII7_SPIAZ|nr:hypothetical protein [Spirochaeta africana]AFG37330.1 hypothetical protein Spiaf_1255 [Spirochaeta africana DSM 8902]